MKNTQTNLSNLERVSIITGSLLLTFSLFPLFQLNETENTVQIFAIEIPLSTSLMILLTLAIIGLAASGTDWLMRNHPRYKGNPTLVHWLLPGLTAWGGMLILNSLTLSPSWWIAFVFIGVFFTFVLLTEYSAIDSERASNPFTTVILSVLAFFFFLLFSFSLEWFNLRWILKIPPLSISVFLISLRVFQLYDPTRWYILEAFAVSAIIVQIASGLHYLPVSPLRVSLLLLGILYAGVNRVIQNNTEDPNRQNWIEMIVILGLFLALAIFIG